MAAARPPQRRAPPSPLIPTVKQHITVEEWEAKTQLDEQELKSINALKTACEKIPLPSKFTTNDSSSPRPSSPALRHKLGASQTVTSRPATPINTNTVSASHAHALHPKQPVQTPQQFYDWFSLIDRSVAHSQESHFRAHLDTVSDHLETCDRLVERIDQVKTEVESMLEGWNIVEEGGRSLQHACETLLEERDKLLYLTDDIDTRLEYFQELEYATRMLNHPGDSLVLQTDFLYMVERVDICIDYLKAHRQYREAEVYLLRFQQCMTRAMTLIKMYFVGSLRSLTADIAKRLSEKDVSSTAQTHLLYTRFKTSSTQAAPLLGELERRAQAHPDELSALLSECRAAYFSSRKSLLIGRLTEEIKGLDPARAELVELTRAGCSYLKQLCTDEFNLFREFFSIGEEQLYAYLENLCDYLYDDLRPRILHEPRLTALCEVCTVLQALMVLDVSTAPESPTSDTDAPSDQDQAELFTKPTGPDQPRIRGLDRLHISQLLHMVLQDAQTRLFFKAQSVIQSDIRYYAPKPEDLAYPDKLVDARKPSGGLEIREKESVSQLFQLPALSKQDTWYPTLRKTVWVLSQLHEFVKPAIFDDIAQEAINLCRISLVAASETIEHQNKATSKYDGCLFLVRHLLILKEMTNALDIGQGYVEPKLPVTEVLSSMLSKTTSLLPVALFASLGMPRAEENITEIKNGIDRELKRACENLIVYCAGAVCAPLRTWVDLVEKRHLDRKNTNLGGGVDRERNRPPPAVEVDKSFRLACERDVRAFIARMRLYLEDDKTVGVLVSHVQDRIVEEYDSFRIVVGHVGGHGHGHGHGGGSRPAVFEEAELREFLGGLCRETLGT